MNENRFIAELEQALERLPLDEKQDILLDIREFFQNGREDGKSDEEIAASLGEPAKIAAELLDAYPAEEKQAKSSGSSSDQLQRFTIEDNSYTKVDIDAKNGSLILLPSSDNVTRVELSGPAEKLELTAETIGDTLTIRLKHKFQWSSLFTFNIKAVALRVFIPKKVYQAIELRTDNGRIQGQKMLAKSFSSKTDNGRIELSEIASDSMAAKSDNGRIELEKVQTGRLKAETDNGRITLRYVEADTIYAESDNGRLQFEETMASLMKAVTDNGRILLSTENLDREIDFETDNGTIEITTKEMPKNAQILAKTGHGRINVYGERNSRTTFGPGEHTVKVKTDNGRIIIR